MRKLFFEELHKQMKKNPNIWVLTGDLGYGLLDNIKKDFPDRFVNCGASECAMIGIAVGLALEGKIPFCYSITNFVLYRPFEFIRNYLHHEQINVKLVASGRDFDYETEGFTHHSPDARTLLKTIPNIKQLWPEKTVNIGTMIEKMIKDKNPYFISLKR